MATGWLLKGGVWITVDRAAGTSATLTVRSQWKLMVEGTTDPPGQSMFDLSLLSTGTIAPASIPTTTVSPGANGGDFVVVELGTQYLAPGRYACTVQESSPWASDWVTWSRVVDLSESSMDGGGDRPPTEPDDDRSWWESQFHLSPDVEEDWAGMVEDFKTCGPWGELSRIQAPSAGTAVGELPDFRLVLPRQRDASGGHVGPVIETGDFNILPLNYTFAQGTVGAAGDAQAPWGAADSLGGWRTAVRTIVGFAAWAFVLVGFISWLKGRVSV